MAGLFEDPGVQFVVLVNTEGQYSLWPHSIDAPAGWETTAGPTERQACVAYIERHWQDLCPAGLAGELLG